MTGGKIGALDVLRGIRDAEKFSGAKRTVLAVLVLYCDKDWKCHPSIETLSHACQLHEATVSKAFSTLKKDGWIAITRRRNTSSVYRVAVKKIVKAGDAGRAERKRLKAVARAEREKKFREQLEQVGRFDRDNPDDFDEPDDFDTE